MSKALAAIATATACLVLVAYADQSAPTSTDSKAVAEASSAAAKRTTSLEVFASGIRQQLLEASAKEAAKGKMDAKVDLSFRVRTFQRKVPSPLEIDVCWEMCGGLHCYLECSAPNPLKR
jgi:hypothetical protein